jgi:UPF0716 protein FxsA
MPLLFLLFIVVPLAEVWFIVRVASWTDWGTTIALLFLVSVLGAVLVKREGVRTWRRFRDAIASARVPAKEVVDGALVLVGGALMLTPGFLTDIVGLLFVLPPTRAGVSRALRSRVRGAFGIGVLDLRPGERERERERPASRSTVDVEVVDVRREERDELEE